mgnify:CR=1 FL=1
MRITIPLLLALGLAACADEPTEEEFDVEKLAPVLLKL